MNVPDYSTLAEAVFNSYPEDVKTLNQLCDQCEADRAMFGEDDPRVQAGEVRVNNLKGLFTRRIAWACAQQDARFGLRKKISGAIATRSDGARHSTDALMMHDDGQIVDVMSDRKWSWGVTPGDTQPFDQWLAPLPPEGEPVPATTPVPVPTPEPIPEPAPVSDFIRLAKRVYELERRVKEDGGLIDDLGAEVSRQAKRLTALESAPAATPAPFVLPKLEAVGSIFGYRVRLPVQKL